MAMRRPPAVVIVARHGARLDIADKQWHLTSPAPYDPPLTYGGWTQCRALGARIGVLLKAREDLFDETLKDKLQEASSHAGADGAKLNFDHQPPRRKKKHRIIIHSSPFLRCVQTSVAISAGISQFYGRQTGDSKTEESAGEVTSKSSKTRKPKLASIKDEDENEVSGSGNYSQMEHHSHYPKPRLRIDAFLGEWLSPDYYECITPPPNSILMVATAKAELLHRGEPVEDAEEPKRNASIKGHFPGGWGSRSQASAAALRSIEGDLPARFTNMEMSDSSLQSNEKSIGHGNDTKYHSKGPPGVGRPTALPEGVGYTPPIPSYAISASEPIPAGYVQHARDACVEIDFQWDSMRGPLNWGDGGALGEEWSAMHQRFRRGLHSMISWYTLHHESAHQLHGHSRVLHPHPNEADDDDTDVVLVLVTHGAGCNALIGALTNQPVLLDVAMASLTMAVQRDGQQMMEQDAPRSPVSPVSPSLPRSGSERPLSQEYVVTLTASTEHLTSSPFTPISIHEASNKSSTSAVPTVTRRSSLRRYNATPLPAHDRSSSLSELPLNNATNDRPRAGVHRSNSSTSVPMQSSASPVQTSPGLWSRSAVDAPTTKPRTWSLMSAGSLDAQYQPQTSTAPSTPPINPAEHHQRPSLPPLSIGVADAIQGAGPLVSHRQTLGEEFAERERGMKRRWTTSEKGSDISR